MSDNGDSEAVFETGPLGEERGLRTEPRLAEHMEMCLGRAEAHDLQVGFERRDPSLRQGVPDNGQDQGVTAGSSIAEAHHHAGRSLAFDDFGEEVAQLSCLVVPGVGDELADQV